MEGQAEHDRDRDRVGERDGDVEGGREVAGQSLYAASSGVLFTGINAYTNAAYMSMTRYLPLPYFDFHLHLPSHACICETIHGKLSQLSKSITKQP